MATQTAPKGVWYEKGRDRWRVTAYEGGRLVSRSYHKSYEAALEEWGRVHTRATVEADKFDEAMRYFLYGIRVSS